MRSIGLLAIVLVSCEDTNGLTGADEGGVPDVDAGTPDVSCPTGQKKCDGACVEIGDPRYGCTDTGCAPCSAPGATGLRCDPGKCRVSGCEEGFDDCDGDASNGCETDLTRPTSCGSCTRNCPTEAKFCDKGQCAASCSPGTTECSGSCADLQKSSIHCGDCATRCGATANGAGACNSGKCGIKCNLNFADCDGNPMTCEPLSPYYKDGDSDGFGAGPKVGDACSAQAGTSLVNTDCKDDDKRVTPGQTLFFSTGYTNAKGETSYDYDCNGVEQNDTSKVTGGACAPDCKVGYTEAAIKRAVGTNIYCGSNTMVTSCSASSCTTSSISGGVGCR